MSGIGHPIRGITATGNDAVDAILMHGTWDATRIAFGPTSEFGPVSELDPVPILSGAQVVSYSFPVSAESYQYAGATVDRASGVDLALFPDHFARASNEQKAAVIFALDEDSGNAASARFAVEYFTDLRIVQDNPQQILPPAHIRVAQTKAPLDITNTTPARVADFPTNDFTGMTADNGDLWFIDNAWAQGPHYGAPRPGNFEWHTQLHELGHGLGLKHGHQVGGVAGVALPLHRDSMEFSVMTYRSAIGGPAQYLNEPWGYAQTWMMLDIAALQHVYGANYKENDGDTVYSWAPNNGRTIINGATAIDPGDNRIFATIWDGGGDDTYDMSAYADGSTIDLEPGSWSRLGGGHQLAALRSDVNPHQLAQGNVYNALLHDNNPASLIENARGGSGGDSIQGNRAANALYGNGGADEISGGAGDDWLFGGSGNDTFFPGEGLDQVDGGSGIDTVSYIDERSGVDVYLPWAATNPSGLDILRGVESVDGSRFDDVLQGDDRPNYLRGFEGADRIAGGGGEDWLEAGYTGTENWLWAGELNDNYGTTDNSWNNLTGGYGIDNLYGGSGGDVLMGYGDNDRLYGNGGVDSLTGGDGEDSFVFRMGDSGRYSPGAANIDVINDFEGPGRLGGDLIDLSAIDGNPADPQDNPLSWASGWSPVHLFDDGDDTVVQVRVSSATQRDRLEGRDPSPGGELSFRIADAGITAGDYAAIDFIL